MYETVTQIQMLTNFKIQFYSCYQLVPNMHKNQLRIQRFPIEIRIHKRLISFPFTIRNKKKHIIPIIKPNLSVTGSSARNSPTSQYQQICNFELRYTIIIIINYLVIIISLRYTIIYLRIVTFIYSQNERRKSFK